MISSELQLPSAPPSLSDITLEPEWLLETPAPSFRLKSSSSRPLIPPQWSVEMQISIYDTPSSSTNTGAPTEDGPAQSSTPHCGVAELMWSRIKCLDLPSSRTRSDVYPQEGTKEKWPPHVTTLTQHAPHASPNLNIDGARLNSVITIDGSNLPSAQPPPSDLAATPKYRLKSPAQPFRLESLKKSVQLPSLACRCVADDGFASDVRPREGAYIQWPHHCSNSPQQAWNASPFPVIVHSKSAFQHQPAFARVQYDYSRRHLLLLGGDVERKPYPGENIQIIQIKN